MFSHGRSERRLGLSGGTDTRLHLSHTWVPTPGVPIAFPHPPASFRFLPAHEAATAIAGPGDYRRNYSVIEEGKNDQK